MSYLEKVLFGINKRKKGESCIFIREVQINENYTIRNEMHQGRKHIVVPVVMMVEGVHKGSAGHLLHLAEDLGRFPEAWNGIPVTIQHPEEDGHNVSANSPDLIDAQTIGRIYNTHMDEGKLKAEAWLDEERLREQSAIALAAIQQQRVLEVSVGVFTEEENVPGIWNGEQYEAIARNHRPDHLALLPGGKGACSWEDGCGIRLNKKGGNSVKKTDDELIIDDKKLSEIMKSLNNENLAVIPINVNEQGLRSLVSTIQAKLDVMDSDTKVHFLQEVYEDFFVYEIRGRSEGSVLYKRTYQVNTDESVEFTGEPVEVRRKIEYVTMESSGLTRTKFNNLKKGVVTMSEKKEGAPCKVTELINHKLTKFTEDNREWLETLEEGQLDTLFPNEPEAKKEDPPQINAEQVKQVVRELFSKQEEYIDLMPENMRDSTRAGLKLHKEQREKMIKGVLDNVKDVWTEDELKSMDANTLNKVFNSIKKEEITDYSLLGTGVSGGKGQTPLYPGGIEIEETKK